MGAIKCLAAFFFFFLNWNNKAIFCTNSSGKVWLWFCRSSQPHIPKAQIQQRSLGPSCTLRRPLVLTQESCSPIRQHWPNVCGLEGEAKHRSSSLVPTQLQKFQDEFPGSNSQPSNDKYRVQRKANPYSLFWTRRGENPDMVGFPVILIARRFWSKLLNCTACL